MVHLKLFHLATCTLVVTLGVNNMSLLGLKILHGTDSSRSSMLNTPNVKDSELLMGFFKVTLRLELYLQQLPLV